MKPRIPSQPLCRVLGPTQHLLTLALLSHTRFSVRAKPWAVIPACLYQASPSDTVTRRRRGPCLDSPTTVCKQETWGRQEKLNSINDV